MVAIAKFTVSWNDPAVTTPPKDGTPIMAEDADGERVVVEWQDDQWVMGRTEAGDWIMLVKAIARWRPLV